MAIKKIAQPVPRAPKSPHGLWSSPGVFALASMGYVVGLNNIWQFPYHAVQYGGGAFVFFYVLFLGLLGLPLMMALRLQARRDGIAPRMAVLVSRHNDGRFIGGIMRRFHLDVVYGSTASKGQHRGGAAGLRALLDRLAAGDSVVITPDGPRGPRRQAAPGVAQLAALSGVAVLPCAAQTARRITLGSWDRMVLPLPFGRGVLVVLPPVAVPRDAAAEALPRIQAAMTEAAEAAGRLCR